MSTSAQLLRRLANGRFERIYLHFGGNVDRTVDRLRKYYSDPGMVEKLFSLGDISSLDDTTETSVFYHRDRQENWATTKPKVCTLDTCPSDDITYVYLNDQWYIKLSNRLLAPVQQMFVYTPTHETSTRR